MKKSSPVLAKDTSEHLCLVSISQSIFSPHNLSVFVNHIRELGSLVKCSAVYRVQHDSEIKLTASLLWQTTESLDACFAILGRTERNLKSTQAILLSFDDVVHVTPELTVPFPKWMYEAHLLIPAAEIWGSYNHPVLQKNLYALAQQFAGSPWGEFYSQGHELLDLTPSVNPLGQLGTQRR